MQPKCCRSDYGRDARWRLGFRAWALGFPKGSSSPLECFTGMVLCDDCKPKVTKVMDFMTPEGCAQVNQSLSDNGRVPADFANGEVFFGDLDDDPEDLPQLGVYR